MFARSQLAFYAVSKLILLSLLKIVLCTMVLENRMKRSQNKNNDIAINPTFFKSTLLPINVPRI